MEHIVWSADPIAISFLGLNIHWYGILFAAAILSGLEFMKWVFKQENKDEALLDSMFLYVVVGIVVGARLGHCLFYDPAFYLANPLKILALWEGGLASHGGGVGVIIALWLYVKKHKMNFLWLLDRIAIATALFGFFVRMGNFMNSEIVGHKTQLPWGIVFAKLDNLPRHPTQLYEAFAYLFIFVFLAFVYKKYRVALENGFLFGLFLVLLFSARFLIEFVKEKQESYSIDFLLTTGQLLSVPFLLFGLFLVVASLRKKT